MVIVLVLLGCLRDGNGPRAWCCTSSCCRRQMCLVTLPPTADRREFRVSSSAWHIEQIESMKKWFSLQEHSRRLCCPGLPAASSRATLLISPWLHALPSLSCCSQHALIMALNIPLLPSPDAPGGRIPSPFTAEVYILSRTAMEVGYTDDARRAHPSKGILFMTTQRLVFLPEDAAKAGYESLELPFRGMTREKLHQPIFACNNLTASCAYYEGMPFSGELNYKIVFKNGGIGVFLPLFNRCLGAARQAASAAAAAGDHAWGGSDGVGGVHPEGDAPDAWANEWGAGNLQSAVAAVDPSDPSRLYLTQPVVESAGTEGRGSMPPLVGGAHASAGGLRRRG